MTGSAGFVYTVSNAGGLRDPSIWTSPREASGQLVAAVRSLMTSNASFLYTSANTLGMSDSSSSPASQTLHHHLVATLARSPT